MTFTDFNLEAELSDESVVEVNDNRPDLAAASTVRPRLGLLAPPPPPLPPNLPIMLQANKQIFCLGSWRSHKPPPPPPPPLAADG